VKNKYFALLILAASITFSTCAKLRVVLGSALTERFFNERKEQYLESFRILNSFGYGDFYIVEGFRTSGPTFLNEYCKNVFYSNVQDLTLRNNGVNEARTLLQGVKHFDFDPDDIVMKLTGRYYLMSDSFLKLIEAHPEVDAFVKIENNGNIYTVGFALRCKYLKEMYESIDYDHLEKAFICIETAVGEWVTKQEKLGRIKVMYVDKLDIKAVMFGSSTNNHWNTWGAGQTLYF